MVKKVWIVMECRREDFHSASSMGCVHSVYEDYDEAIKAQEDLMKYNKKCFPNDFYTNWIINRWFHYEK